jgi:hypothetical protein
MDALRELPITVSSDTQQHQGETNDNEDSEYDLY